MCLFNSDLKASRVAGSLQGIYLLRIRGTDSRGAPCLALSSGFNFLALSSELQALAHSTVTVSLAVWNLGFFSRWGPPAFFKINPLIFSCARSSPPGTTFSSCGTLPSHGGASVLSTPALGRRAAEPCPRAPWPRGVWDPPGPGVGSASPASAGALLTTGLPGKPDPATFHKRAVLVTGI